MRTKRRLLSILLAAIMIISMLPVATHATERIETLKASRHTSLYRHA